MGSRDSRDAEIGRNCHNDSEYDRRCARKSFAIIYMMLMHTRSFFSRSFMAYQHSALSRLLSANAQWAVDVEGRHPGFFKQLARGQSPEVLWIGCADSRVPESLVSACRPGELFVHRNIANQFHLNDDSAQSVLSYAVDVLGVKHIVIVGHTQCGGAAACLQSVQSPSSTPTPDTPLNRWLTPLTSLAASVQSRLPTPSASEALTMLVEENVKAQVQNLCKAAPVTAAWAAHEKEGRSLWVHGWVFEIENGRLRDLEVSKGPTTADSGNAIEV